MHFTEHARPHASHMLRDVTFTPYWLATPRDPLPMLTGEATADLLIVGGGFTGLWAALLARQRDLSRDIVVIDAERVGHAASGRNGGFLHASLTHGFANGLQRWPEEMSTLLRLGHENLGAIRATVEQYGIDCDWRDGGELEVAFTAHDAERIREHPALAARHGERLQWLDAEQVRMRIDSPIALGAVFEPDGVALVDPAALHRGLLDACREQGIRVFEHTRLLDLESAGPGVLARTSFGGIRARRVLLATNAARSPIASVRRRIVPVYDAVLVTEPLSSAQWNAVGWRGHEGLKGAGNRFHYARRTRDGRILWGGFDALYHYGSAMGPHLEHDMPTYARLADHFGTAFPQLEGLRFTHAWAGAIDTCTRFTPFWTRAHHDRVVSVAGFTGLGVGASRFGAAVALDLLDDRSSEARALTMVRTRPIPFPPEPARSGVIRLTQRSLARADRDGGRRDPWLRLLDALHLGFDS